MYKVKRLRQIAKDQARIILSQQARQLAERAVSKARIEKLQRRLARKRWPWWRRLWLCTKRRRKP